MTRRADTVNATPTTMTYDTFNTGLLTSMAYPAGSDTSLSYDAEGELLSGMLPNKAYVNAYTRRGEALSSTLDVTGSVVSYGFANGVMIPIKQSTSGTYWKPYTYRIDAIRGLPVDTHAINTCTQGNTSCGTDSGGDVSSDTKYQYDRAARQSGSTLTGPQTISTGNASEGTVSKQYDAEDHLLEQDFTSMPGFGAKFPQTWSLHYAYGPEGHPFTVGTTSHVSSGAAPTDFQDDSLFWDDDAMLFSEDSQGNIDDFKIGTLADYQPHANLKAGGQGPLLSVIDRDGKGQTIACHYSDGTTFAAASYGARLSTITSPASSPAAPSVVAAFWPCPEQTACSTAGIPFKASAPTTRRLGCGIRRTPTRAMSTTPCPRNRICTTETTLTSIATQAALIGTKRR